jgi:hypothetical protein
MFKVSKLLKFLLQSCVFYAADGGGGGGGDDPAAAQIAAAVAKEVAGLKAKNEELLGKVKDSAAALKAFEGIDPVKTRELLARFENDDEAKLIAEGKISEVIARRTEKKDAETERLIREAKAEAESANKRALAFQGRVLDDAIRSAAAAAGLHKHAIDDALFRGRSMFTLDENGKAVQLNSDGEAVLGKDGKTAFSPTEWLDSMKETAPHWFPASASGGGASGKPAGAGSKDFSHLPPTERMTAARAAKK